MPEPTDLAPPPEQQAAPPPAPAPLTNQTCADEVNALIDRYTAANLKPLVVIATILTRRGAGFVEQARASFADWAERALVSLESGNAKEAKK